MSKTNKNIWIYTPIIITVSIVVGMFLGRFFQISSNQPLVIYPQVDKISAVLNYIEEEYVDTVLKEELIENTIPDILENLDPHSIYIPAKDIKQMSEPLDGSFEGIGIQFNIQEDTVIVLNTIAGGPSEKIGLLAGDRIIEVDDSVIAGININNNMVMKFLKGERGTKVKVGILRRNVDEILYFNITRDKIPIYSIDISYMVNSTLGYIKINRFARSTGQEFEEAVIKLKSKGMSEVIVDLRGNGGGYMSGAIEIADQFLEAGKTIVYTEGKNRPKNISYSTKDGLCKDMDLSILMDEWSASASEILAGALQDNDRCNVIGRRSFGKGLVQEPTFFNDGSSVRLTVARYYTPTGRSIQKSYENGSEDYRRDILNRANHGEFEQQDSIQFPDSLKFTTPGGKTVYGGGGIMPDIFVAMDTVGVTPYFQKIVNRTLIYKFAFDYADNNRSQLNKIRNIEELEEYLLREGLLMKFIDFVTKEGIEENNEQLNVSKEIIETQLLAYVSRHFFDNEGFYPIFHKIDKTFKEAVVLMQQ